MPAQPRHDLCHRCGASLTPGRDDSYIVRIEAYADPTPPAITRQDLEADTRGEIERLIQSMRHVPQQELMDQVHRRLTLRLCTPCYRGWIEDPAGRPDQP